MVHLREMGEDGRMSASPLWIEQTRYRLRRCMALAAALVAALMLLEMPAVERAQPVRELLVRILLEEARPVAVRAADDRPAERRPETPPRTAPVETAPVEESRERAATDWYAEMPDAAAATLDAQPREYSLNPGLDARRQRAAGQFRPSRAKKPRPIWENVERDTLGRTVLRSGDCYRVIDDPNAGSREAFETFGQYLVTCLNSSDRPRELPWVSELRNRRGGLARYGHPAAE